MEFHDFIAACSTGNWQAAHDAGLNSLWAKKETPKRAQQLMTQFLAG